MQEIERINYFCNSCNFEFSRKANVYFRHCPYCGKEGTVEVKSGDFASKLLEEL